MPTYLALLPEYLIGCAVYLIGVAGTECFLHLTLATGCSLGQKLANS